MKRPIRQMRRALLLFSALLVVFVTPPAHAVEPLEVVVEGVSGGALENVRRALVLPVGLVREGRVDPLWLRRFAGQAADRARVALEPFGYYRPRVVTGLERVTEEAYRLVVTIRPGEPVRVAELKVGVAGAGAGEETLKKLVRAFPLYEGSVLLQGEYEAAKSALKSRAQELGYLDADFTRHEIRINKQTLAARVFLTLETGAKYRFGEVTIRGGDVYPERFLRRYLAFKPGDTFSYALLGETQLNYTNSERFREVGVTPDMEGARDLLVPVRVELKPGSRRHLRPGIGYGTDTGARFIVRYRDLNMFSRGHEWNNVIYLSERLQGVVSSYAIPSSRDIKSSTGLQLNLQKEDVSTYESTLTALEASRSRSFGRGELGTLYVRFQEEQFTIGAQDSRSRLVLPGLRFSENGYDNLIRPTGGFRYLFDLRGTSPYLGSNAECIQFIGEGSYLLPLPARLALHTRLRTGITFLSDPLSDLPPSLRFFAGGDQSVRGYSYQSLGPRDATGTVVGGKQMVAGSLELERALFENWGVSAFFDAGNAFNSFTDIRVYEGVGIGTHYYSPVGALNLYLARQIGVEKPALRVHFTVGFQL